MTVTEIKAAVVGSFRAVRWATGHPFCARCHGDKGLQPAPPSMPTPPDLDSYYCRLCRYAFSDLTGTVLEKTSRPLALWAWLALGGDPNTIALPKYCSGSQRARLREMAARLHDTALAAAWKQALTQDGVSSRDLEPLVHAWADGVGTRPRGRHARGAVKDPAHRRKAN